MTSTEHETAPAPLSVEELLLRKRPPDAFTFAEVDALPDEGYRYELLDGILLVSPALNNDRQRVVRDIFVQLYEQVGDATGDETYEASTPYPVTIRLR